MPVPLIAPLIPVAMKLAMDLIWMARDAGELDRLKFEEIRDKLDEECGKFPEWKDL